MARRFEIRTTALSILGLSAALAIGWGVRRSCRTVARRGLRTGLDEQRYRSIYLYSPNAIFEMDLTGRIIDANPAADRISGYPLSRGGINWRDLVSPEDRRKVLRHFSLTARGESQLLEICITRKDGRPVDLTVTAVPIVVDGEIIGIIGIGQDITERKAAERKVQELLAREQIARADSERGRKEIERLMEMKARFIRGFSHDLKNPLGAVDGHAQLLETGAKGELTAPQLESVQRIRRAIRTVLDLINALVDLSRAEAGALHLDYRRTEPASLILATIEEYRAEIEAHDLAFDAEIPDTLPPIVTDPDRVHQILGNLLSNAIKYTPEGGRIGIHAAVQKDRNAPGPGHWIRVSIQDSGPGIPEDQREQIFDEFVRMEPGARGGSGLGLAISRRLARLLGGDITVESEPGQGSCFILWLTAETRERSDVEVSSS